MPTPPTLEVTFTVWYDPQLDEDARYQLRCDKVPDMGVYGSTLHQVLYEGWELFQQEGLAKGQEVLAKS